MLPSLSLRSTRVRLIAWSFDDAAFGSNDGGRGSKPQSRALGRNLELWNAGSYAELERAVDMLPREVRRVFRAEHLNARSPFASRESLSLVRVGMLMPREVFVPAVISEAAGFVPSEAKHWARRWRAA